MLSNPYKLHSIKKIWQEDAKHNLDSLELMCNTCVNEPSDSLQDTMCAYVSFSSILHHGVSYNMK